MRKLCAGRHDMTAVIRLIAFCSFLLAGELWGQTLVEAKRFIGADAYSRDGRKLGVVTLFLANSDGQIKTAVVRTKAFIFFDCDMAVPWEKVSLSKDRLNVDMTRDEFNSLPEWKAR